MKKSYVMYKSWSKMFLQLEPEKAGKLIQAICAYQDGEEYVIGDPVLEAVFSMFKETFDADRVAYEEKCEKNRTNALNRLRSQANANDRLRSTYDNDNEYDNDNDLKEKESKKKLSARFVPPSLQEVKGYCLERKNKVDPEGFIDFYTSKNWMVGKTKMKDWKAAVRTWERRDRGSPEKNKFNRFEHNDYDFEELERALLNG